MAGGNDNTLYSGYCLQWVLPTVGIAYSGYCLQWVLPTVGIAYSGYCLQWVLPTVCVFEFRNAIIIRNNYYGQYRSRMILANCTIFRKAYNAIVTVSRRFLNPRIQRQCRSSFLHRSADGVVNSSSKNLKIEKYKRFREGSRFKSITILCDAICAETGPFD